MQGQGRATIAADVDPEPEAVETINRVRGLLYAGLLLIAGSVLVLDQATKLWALQSLRGEPSRSVVGDLIRLELTRNAGAAFSIGTRATWLLTLIGVAVLVWVLLAAQRVGSRGWAIALGLLLGGSLGNLVDRFLRAPGPGRGQVIDFIDYGGLFIGNVADIAIVGAAGLIIVYAARGLTLSGERVGGTGRHTEGARGRSRSDSADPS